MLPLTTAALVRIGAVVLAIATIFTAIAGWVALDVIEASLSVAPELEAAGEPSRGMVGSIDETLDEVRDGLRTLEAIADRVATSTGDVADVVDEVAILSTDRIPAALASLEEALPALVDTAAVIDSTMRTLSILGVEYRPQVPLDEAFSDVQAQMEGLPESIRTQGEGLGALVDELRASSTDTERLVGQIDTIERSLADTQVILADYGTALDSLERLGEVSDRIQASLPVGRIALAVLALAGLLLGAIGWQLGSRLRG